MDKKIDLDAKNNSTQNTIKVRPNSRNEITLNLQNVSIGKKRVNINNPSRQNGIKQQRPVNYYRNKNSSQNSQEQNFYNEEDELENDDLEEEDEENNSDESDGSTETDENEETPQPIKNNLQERIIDNAKQDLKNKTTDKLKKHAINKAKMKAAKKALAKKAAAKTAGTAAKAAVSAGTTAATAAGSAAAGGAVVAVAGGTTITLGWIAIPIILVILLVALIVVIFGGTVAYSAEAVSQYGQICPIIIVTDTDCDNSGQNCTNRYSGDVELETYVAGVVAAKAKKENINNAEYYKMAAIIARTNVQKNITSSCTVKGNSDFQEYMDITDSTYANEIKTAVADTTNIVMVKDETLIDVKSQDGSSNWKINSQEALNLINNGSKYEDVLKKYYGTDIEITNNTVILTGVNGFINPLSKIICNSAFGYREIHPVTGEKNKFHGGIDLGTNGKPAPIYAAKSGTVVSVYKHVYLENDNRIDNNNKGISDWNNGYGAGNLIKIDHGDGTSTRYLHIKYGSIPDSISIGATVTQGQQIGLTGATGRSDGVHLHYDVIVNGTKVDPADYLDLQNASRLEKCRR